MFFVAVYQTGVCLFRYNSYLLISVFKSMCQASLADISFSASEIIIFHLVHVLLADDEHL